MHEDHELVAAPGAPGAPARRLFSDLRRRRAVLMLGLVAAAIGLLAASSWLSVPFYPVPLTMQTLAVLVVGGLLGPRLGPAAVIGYLALGLAGAPVFHNGFGGPAVMFGPTGGYLVGFVPAAFLMGLFGRRVCVRGSTRSACSVSSWASGSPGGAGLKDTALLAGGALLAEMAIYAAGVAWLAVVCTGGDLGRALAVGAVPYLLGDILKVAVAVGALRLGATAVRGRKPFLF